MGANVFKDLFAGIRDIVGGRSATYEAELRKARTIALDELALAAAELGANAVVGIDLDYETVGGQGSMLMVAVNRLLHPSAAGGIRVLEVLVDEPRARVVQMKPSAASSVPTSLAPPPELLGQRDRVWGCARPCSARPPLRRGR